MNRPGTSRAGRRPSRLARLLGDLRRIEPWQGTKRLIKFLLGLYARPMTIEERLRALGVKLGEEVQLQPFSLDERYARLLTIDDHASIGKGTIIHLSDSTLNTASESPNPPPALFGPVRICRGAVIGRDTIILAGVTVGEYAIVGAGSLVTRDVPPHTVAAGVPARVICSTRQLEEGRFSEEAIRRDRRNLYIYMPNWRRRRRIGMTPEEQDLYYEENFPKIGC